MVATGVGFMELLLILLMGGGSFVPAGIPPLPEDPAFMKAMPAETMIALEWFGCSEADPASDNATERLAAEKEIRTLVNTVIDAVQKTMKQELRGEEAAIADDVFFLVTMLYNRPGCLFLSDFNMSPEGPSVKAGLIVNAKGYKDAVKKLLLKYESLLLEEMSRGSGQMKPTSLPIGDATFRGIPIPPSVPPFAWGFLGDYLVLALGEGMPGTILGNMNGSGGLASYAPAKAALKKVAVDEPCFRSYINIAQVLEKARPMIGSIPEVNRLIDALAVNQMQTVAAESGLEGEGFVSRSYLAAPGERKGLLSLLKPAPLTQRDLSIIPGDATIAMALKLDPDSVYDELLQILEAVDPRAKAEFLEEVISEPQMALGIDIEKDIFEALGDTWCLWNAPSDGGLVITGLTLAASVDKPERFTRTVDKIVAFIQGQTGTPRTIGSRRARRGVYVDSCVHEGTKIYYLNSVGEEFPLAIAWCVHKDKFLMSMFPQMLKSTISRGMNPGTSFARNPELGPISNSLSVSYVNMPEFFRMLYPVLHPFAQMACSELQREGFDIRITALPTAGSILPHLKSEVSFVKAVEGGLFSENRGSLPLGGGVLSGPLASSVLFSVAVPAGFTAKSRAVHMQERSVAAQRLRPLAPRVIAPETPVRPRRLQQAKELSTLRSVGVGLQMYKIEHGKFPPSLEMLWTGSQPYLSRPARDHRDRPFHYFGPDVQLQKIIAASTAPFSGVRQVLYPDGKVKSIPESKYQEYERKIKASHREAAPAGAGGR